MKKNNKGFTLVELLAVIVIMGILMMVAIPSVTRTIENSRKDTFVDIAKSYGNAVRTLWTSDNLTCEGTVSSAVDDGDYYILINTKESAKDSLPVLLDQGGKSSWGNRDVNGYVRVNISTTPGVDNDGDGDFEEEPKRVTKFYVALSDGTHGVLDDNTSTMDELVRGNVNMTLSEDDLKKIELTVDDGRLSCVKDVSGYICVNATPINSISGVCVDDQTSARTITASDVVAESFAEDDWGTIIVSLRSGNHPYQVGDTKEIDMGSFGTHTIRIANLSTPAECSTPAFSQTACGVVLEFADIIINYQMNESNTNVGGWKASRMREYLNNEIYNALPSELRNGIFKTTVVSGHGSAAGETNFITEDNLYLLSTKEVWGNATSIKEAINNTISKDSARDMTRQLDYYKEKNVTLDNYSGAAKLYNGYKNSWRLRSVYSTSTKQFFIVNKGGVGWGNGTLSTTSFGISPAFRIG